MCASIGARFYVTEKGKCSKNEDCGVAVTCTPAGGQNACLCPGGIQRPSGECYGTYQYTLPPNGTIKVTGLDSPLTITVSVGKCMTVSANLKNATFKSNFVGDRASMDIEGDFTEDFTFLVHRDEGVVTSSFYSHIGLAEGTLSHPYAHCRFGQIVVHGLPEAYDSSKIAAYVTENLSEPSVSSAE